MKTSIKTLFFHVVGFILVYLLTEGLVKGLHHLFFHPNDYLTYTNPTLQFTKYFALGIAISISGFRLIELTKAGKGFFTLLIIASILGFFITTLSFQAADEEKIVTFRVLYRTEYDWNDVDHVSTHVYRKDSKRTVGGARSSPRKVIKEYNVHLTDGTKLNLWNDLNSTYLIHHVVIDKKLHVQHKTEAEHFYHRFTNYFKADYDKAMMIFGVTE